MSSAVGISLANLSNIEFEPEVVLSLDTIEYPIVLLADPTIAYPAIRPLGTRILYDS